ncbi:MAG: ribonuclease P protein component [Verrucomicrobia bacterium]|nr:ribonuclease P protein component [Verrucomicrobiota bacterium]
MRFRAEQHLRRQLDFQHVRTHGRRHDCGAFTLWYARQATVDSVEPAKAPPVARLGVVASRAAVGIAVQRARAKRRLREVFRHHQELVPAGYDLLLVARTSLNRLEYREIERKFVEACRKVFPSAHV